MRFCLARRNLRQLNLGVTWFPFVNVYNNFKFVFIFQICANGRTAPNSRTVPIVLSSHCSLFVSGITSSAFWHVKTLAGSLYSIGKLKQNRCYSHSTHQLTRETKIGAILSDISAPFTSLAYAGLGLCSEGNRFAYRPDYPKIPDSDVSTNCLTFSSQTHVRSTVLWLQTLLTSEISWYFRKTYRVLQEESQYSGRPYYRS
jgi:hypothetical protein